MSNKTVLISLSGGMDSATLVGLALHNRYEVELVHYQYGSKHNPFEMQAYQAVKYFYEQKIGTPIKSHHIDLTDVMHSIRSNLLASGGAIPEGHYQAANMSQTVVPGRNLLFISIAAAIAESEGIREVWIGAHSGDHEIYPDCRPGFIHAAAHAVRQSSDQKVYLVAPFLFGNKTSIIATGMGCGVPYGLTRTCYKNQAIACGKCGACQERLEAFAANKLEDPIDYESRVILPKSV